MKKHEVFVCPQFLIMHELTEIGYFTSVEGMLLKLVSSTR